MTTSWPIKFRTAAKPGVKRKSDKDTQNKYNEKYEGNRKRLFLISWATDRPWLQNDNEKGMTCKICVEHYGDKLSLQGMSKKHLYIAGSKNYKISTVSDYEKSRVHIDAVKNTKITNKKTPRILRVLHIAIHCPLRIPAAKIRGPKILEISPCSD